MLDWKYFYEISLSFRFERIVFSSFLYDVSGLFIDITMIISYICWNCFETGTFQDSSSNLFNKLPAIIRKKIEVDFKCFTRYVHKMLMNNAKEPLRVHEWLNWDNFS
jgi:hypothetical protein